MLAAHHFHAVEHLNLHIDEVTCNGFIYKGYFSTVGGFNITIFYMFLQCLKCAVLSFRPMEFEYMKVKFCSQGVS